MIGHDDRILAFLVSISDEIAKLRNDVRAVQAGLVRIGAIEGKTPESGKSTKTWNPPTLKRLGDMVTIIARSDPASAAALAKVGDTERDPSKDPEKDPDDQNQADGTNRADGTDPRFKDNDTRRFGWFRIKKDFTINARNVTDVTDVRPNEKDDNDGVAGQTKPDTELDRVEG